MLRRALAVLALLPALAAPAYAQTQPYGTNDAGGAFNILPPGSNGNANAAQLGAFLSTGARPAHSDDQLRMYGDLVYHSPGLREQDLTRFFKDAGFGVRDDDVERRYRPGGRTDVEVVRDRGFGVPHIHGSTRAGTLFAIGYVTGEDRMFFTDVLRNTARAQLAAFAGGSPSLRALDRAVWADTPYLEEELTRQLADPALYGADGPQLLADVQAYVAGLNQFIGEAKLDASKMPGEYAAIGRPQGPDPWKAEDVIAIASLVGGIFGKGGGGELGSALLRERFLERFGARRGQALWEGFRAADDPEAYTTIRKPFRGTRVPRRADGVAVPDPGSVVFADVLDRPGAVPQAGSDRRGGRPATGAILSGLARDPRRAWFPGSGSNALLVSARESETGHPIAVFGPQTAYFAPQILMEQDVHGPGYDARGVSFPGTNIYVQLGRGRDYAWSATSAGNDNIDTFAVDLCEPDGKAPTLRSMHYVLRGRCVPFDVLTRVNRWQQSAADMTPSGQETYTTLRSKYGIVTARATVGGKPVAYTRLRSTYMREVVAARGFLALNDPGRVRSAEDAARAFHDISFTFNWFYVDSEKISYYNSGDLPIRPTRVNPDLPVRATERTEWAGWNPDTNVAAYQPPSRHPQSIDDAWYGNWNNKQAPGYRADDLRYNYSAVDRGELLGDRLDAATRGDGKMGVTDVVDAMEDAGTVDLRGAKILRWALKVVGRPSDPELAEAVRTLHRWRLRGAHRLDRDRDGHYDEVDAVRIMDAWWPRMVEAVFTSRLGRPLGKRVIDHIGLGDHPNIHQGSAFDDGIWGHLEKDLRSVLRRRVRGPLALRLCGAGVLERCRADLRATLRDAIEVRESEQFRTAGCPDGDEVCFDEVRHVPTGGVTQPGIHWINRPTFQQVVSFPRRLAR